MYCSLNIKKVYFLLTQQVRVGVCVTPHGDSGTQIPSISWLPPTHCQRHAPSRKDKNTKRRHNTFWLIIHCLSLSHIVTQLQRGPTRERAVVMESRLPEDKDMESRQRHGKQIARSLYHSTAQGINAIYTEELLQVELKETNTRFIGMVTP